MRDVLNPIVAAGGTTAFEDPLSLAEIAALTLEAPGLIAAHVALDPAGGVAGFQYLCRHPALPPEIGDIATFARRSPKVPGIGRALFPATRAAARAAGLTAIEATIRADNVGGLAYYSAMGFVDHRVTRGVPLKDGTPVDRIGKRYRL